MKMKEINDERRGILRDIMIWYSLCFIVVNYVNYLI